MEVSVSWTIDQKTYLKKFRGASAPLPPCIRLWPYTTDLGKTFKRILEKYRVYELSSNLQLKQNTILSSGKNIAPGSKRRGVVCEVPCRECEHKYIGQTKRSLSTRFEEHQRDTLPENILKNPEKAALTKHAPQSSHVFRLGLRPRFTSCK